MLSLISAVINLIGNPVVLYYALGTYRPNYLVVFGWFFLVSLIHPHLRGMIVTVLGWLIDMASIGVGVGIVGAAVVFFALLYGSAIAVIVIYILLGGLWLHSVLVVAENVIAWRNQDNGGHGPL